MEPTSSNRDYLPDREFDLIVVGASGFTGRLAVEHLTAVGRDLARSPRWAVSGRDEARTRAALAEVVTGDVPFVGADLAVDELRSLTARTSVVINVAGPFTPTAPRVIEACIATRTSYVDLSGEIPLLHDVIRRFDGPARSANVRVVQMAGWEALPADLTALLASRRATAAAEGIQAEEEGVGAADPIARVVVRAKFVAKPSAKVPMAGSVSAGTLASIVEMLESDEAKLVGDTAALLPDRVAGASRPGPLRLRPFTSAGRRLAAFTPVSFLNAPIVHRSAALLAAERGIGYQPATYLEGVDIGRADAAGGWRRDVGADVRAGVQRALIGIARSPGPVRRPIAALLRRLLPATGSGPAERFLRDWEWYVESTAHHRDGAVGQARLDGRGHPGYTATAAMLVEVALRIASGRAPPRYGCLTPALAMGSLDLDPWFVPDLRLS